MTPEEEKELQEDVREFIANVKDRPEKTFTLTVTGKGGRYTGGELYINKPGGRGLRLTD